MKVSEETREKIIQNLLKLDSSFHYKDNEIHSQLLISAKNKKKYSYILLLLSLVLYLFGPEKIFWLTQLDILYLVVIFILYRTYQIWSDYVLGKLEIIEDFIKNREI